MKEKYSTRDQIKKYLFHKNAFHISENPYLNIFVELIEESSDCLLERSCKIEGSELYPARFNIWYFNKNHKKNINPVLSFLKRISECPGVTLDLGPLKHIFDKNFDLGKIWQVAAGIDHRNNLGDSRVKFWAIIFDYPKIFNRILLMHGYNKNVLNLIYGNLLLFGLDFYFDGRTKIKIYPRLDRMDLENFAIQNKLKHTFSRKILKLVKNSYMLHTSFLGNNFSKVLHFHPNKWDLFVRQLNNKRITKVNKTIVNRKLDTGGVISLRENEINNSKLKNVNIYRF
jgi:LynF/TruF/PatF family peptide O-prenyltransferase